MRRQREQGMSKHGYVCQVQATQDGSKLTGRWLRITFTMVRSFVSLTRDGNRCRVFSAIGQSTLPHENSFTFFSYSVMDGTFFLVLNFILLSLTQDCSQPPGCAYLFYPFLFFCLFFIATSFRS